MREWIDKLYKIPFVLQSKTSTKILPDPLYLSCTYRGLMKKHLDWKNPGTFNEKLQVLKLAQKDSIFTQWSDKVTAKQMAARILGKDHIVENYCVCDSLELFKKQKLPEKYVVKTTHGSGGVWIIDKEHPLDEKIEKEIEASLKENYYHQWRELCYRNIQPRILAERFLQENIQDYKFFCFHGKPEIILVCSDRQNGLKEDFYSCTWEWLEMQRSRHPRSQKPMAKPQHLDQMLAMAQKLAEGFPFVRVDLFEVGSKVYFGEMTFYPACGFEGFSDDSWDEKMGEWIHLDSDMQKEAAND